MNTFYTHIIKRALDILVALTAMMILSPFFILAVLILLFSGHSRLFFTQTRVGLHEKMFTLFKLRTMTDRKDENGRLLPDAQRLTRAGKFIRKTSLDELPQLLNVLRGDMSIVGPRPLLVEYLPLYSEEQKKRHWVKPGITGWAQVNGRNAISWQKKFELDIWYVQHLSFWLDLKIICYTILKIVISSGISQDGQATMEPFRGQHSNN